MALSDEQLGARLRRLLERSRDEEFHDLYWSYREGRVTRRQLLVHPAFARAVRGDLARGVEAVEEAGGTLEQLRSRVAARLADEGLQDVATGTPDHEDVADPGGRGPRPGDGPAPRRPWEDDGFRGW